MISDHEIRPVVSSCNIHITYNVPGEFNHPFLLYFPVIFISHATDIGRSEMVDRLYLPVIFIPHTTYPS